MRIFLYLVKKNQRIRFFLHSISCQHTYLQIKVLHSPGIIKQSVIKRIFKHIDFDKIFKHLLSHMTDNISFSDLPRAIYY